MFISFKKIFNVIQNMVRFGVQRLGEDLISLL